VLNNDSRDPNHVTSNVRVHRKDAMRQRTSTEFNNTTNVVQKQKTLQKKHENKNNIKF